MKPSLLWNPVYCGPLFNMESYFLKNLAYYGNMFITGPCLLWNPVYDRTMFNMKPSLLWNAVY